MFHFGLKINVSIFPLILLLIFSLLGMKALFHPGLFTAHDIWHQVVRFYYYTQAVNDGQFPPYWIGQLANGFGYPLFLFSYHFPWILGTAMLKVGFSIPASIKMLFFLSYLGSGISMYLLIAAVFRSKTAALLSAILYLWVPYHFLIIFVGASMGIAFIFTFLPLLFLGIHLIAQKSRWGTPCLAVALSGLILSHIMHLIFILPAAGLFFGWEFISSQKKMFFLKNILFGLILGFLISSFYFIPALYYNQFTRARTETGFSELYKRHFINFNQLIYSKWGYGPIVNNAKNGENSFQLGFSQWFSVLSLVLLLILKRIKKEYFALSLFLLGGFSVSVFMMLDYSGFIWKYLTKFAAVDFPFRLLLPAVFIASVCSAVVFVNLGGKSRYLFATFLILLALYSNRNHINVNQYTDFPISAYLDIETEKTTNTFNEYLPINANPALLNKPWNEIIASGSSVLNSKQTTNSLSFDLNTTNQEFISLGQFYFPGQTLYLDGKITLFNTDKEGRINFTPPRGTHSIVVKYQPTLLIKISKYLTGIGLLLIISLIFKERLSKKRSYS